jgi:hypothetical protein
MGATVAVGSGLNEGVAVASWLNDVLKASACAGVPVKAWRGGAGESGADETLLEGSGTRQEHRISVQIATRIIRHQRGIRSSAS